MQDCRTSCIYRIAQEGLPLLLPWMGKQVVHVRAETLLRQLTESSIALPESHRLPMEVKRQTCHRITAHAPPQPSGAVTPAQVYRCHTLNAGNEVCCIYIVTS